MLHTAGAGLLVASRKLIEAISFEQVALKSPRSFNACQSSELSANAGGEHNRRCSGHARPSFSAMWKTRMKPGSGFVRPNLPADRGS